MPRLMKPAAVAVSLVLLALIPWFVVQGVEETDKPAAAKKDAPAQKPADAAAEDTSADNEMEASLPPSRGEAAIRQAMLQKTEVEFIETSLKDCLLFLRDQHKITIILDEALIQDEGVSIDQPITLAVKGIRLQSLLHLMLHPLQLTWIIEDEVLKITTEVAAGENLTMHVYDVQQILSAGQVEEDLVDLLTSTIQPDSWVEAEGAGSVRVVPAGLVVRQTQQVHAEIERLFIELELLAEDHPADKRPTADVMSLKVYHTELISQHGKEPLSAEELAIFVPDLIAPESWDSAGGKGSVRGAKGMLFIKNTRKVHGEVARLLKQMHHKPIKATAVEDPGKLSGAGGSNTRATEPTKPVPKPVEAKSPDKPEEKLTTDK